MLGDVACTGNAGVTADDFAFIEVRAGFAVDRAVKGYPQYPTGSTVSAQTAAGDLVQQSGYDTSISVTRQTQDSRQDVLTSDTAQVWQFAGATGYGGRSGANAGRQVTVSVPFMSVWIVQT